ncbi:YqcC family protein, partial [Vibrio sp. M260118]|uniref:YqcC family protein n=1 Tax=Vibrio sp. M260118 TaxID=3020896 RepID=UPI002F3FC376
MTKEKQIAELLNAVEAELRRIGLWQAQPPSEEALSSQEPFALDTLEPRQWLQWV